MYLFATGNKLAKAVTQAGHFEDERESVILFDQDILIKFCPPRDSIKVRPSFTYLSIGGRDFMDTLRSFAETKPPKIPKGNLRDATRTKILPKGKERPFVERRNCFSNSRLIIQWKERVKGRHRFHYKFIIY